MVFNRHVGGQIRQVVFNTGGRIRQVAFGLRGQVRSMYMLAIFNKGGQPFGLFDRWPVNADWIIL